MGRNRGPLAEQLADLHAIRREKADHAEAARRQAAATRVERILSTPAVLGEHRTWQPTEPIHPPLTEWEARFVGLDSECPGQFRPWLLRVATDYSRRRKQDPSPGYWGEDFFFDDARCGLVSAVLSNLDAHRGDSKYAWETHNHLPDDEIVFDVLLHALDHAGAGARAAAIRWLPTYAPSASVAVEILTGRLPRDGDEGFYAAVGLSRLAPHTPGVAERLIEAVRSDLRPGRNPDYYGAYIPSPAEEATAALTRLGRQIPEAVAAVAEAVFRHQTVPPKEGIAAYLSLGGSPADLTPRLPHLLAEWVPRDESNWPSDGHFLHAVHLLGQWGCHAEIILPALASVLEHARNGAHAREAEQAIDDFLNGLAANAAQWTPEDTWLAALCGVPVEADDWLIYADWLEERGEPRATLVRLRHAQAVAWQGEDKARWAECLDREEEWSSEHGRVWSDVYDRIARGGSANP